jgi:type I restriction enzyme R subunit
MTFNESNTVEAFVRDKLCGEQIVARDALSSAQWDYVAPNELPRQPQEVLVEQYVRDALIRLNSTIAEQPDRAEDVIHRLRAPILGVRTDGLVKANEEFAAWLTEQRSMPFGPNGEHVTIKLVDFKDLTKNRYVLTQQFSVRAGNTEKRADLVLLVNGIPLVVIEAKTPVRSSQTWLDGAVQVHEVY